MEIKIKQIIHEDKVGKSGKQFTSCRIKTFSQNENKDVWISGFGNEITRTWVMGDMVDVNISQTDNGYYNFEMNDNSKPSPTAVDYLKAISEKLDLIISTPSYPNMTTPTTNTAPMGNFGANTAPVWGDSEPSPEDLGNIPF